MSYCNLLHRARYKAKVTQCYKWLIKWSKWNFRSFLNYLGGLDEIRNKDWLQEYEKQKQSLTLKKWTNEYSNVTLTDLETKGTLGVGGFGRVDLVVLKSDSEKSFALKKLKKKVMVEQQQQEHVLNEKHIMQACDSPFICKLVLKRIYVNKIDVYIIDLKV